MALVPFPVFLNQGVGDTFMEPRDSLARRNAIAELRGALDGERIRDVLKSTRAELDPRDLVLARLADAVSANIEDYAPDAPQAVKDEALLRAAAWLSDSFGASRAKQVDGDVAVAVAPVHSGPWMRQSGAMSLLSTWRSRGVGTIQKED